MVAKEINPTFTPELPKIAVSRISVFFPNFVEVYAGHPIFLLQILQKLNVLWYRFGAAA